jgi:hypothetical protein
MMLPLTTRPAAPCSEASSTSFVRRIIAWLAAELAYRNNGAAAIEHFRQESKAGHS